MQSLQAERLEDNWYSSAGEAAGLTEVLLTITSSTSTIFTCNTHCEASKGYGYTVKPAILTAAPLHWQTLGLRV